MTQPSLEQLNEAPAGSVDTERLHFAGLRGDASRHLTRARLEEALAALPATPRDRGRVDVLVARGADGERDLPERAFLTVQGGMPGDRWAAQSRYGPDYQLATARTDFARVVANGQPVPLHGDNLFVTLDLSDENLPAGSRLQMGEALLEVTPQAHNGCKKWVQRFGLAPLQLNLDPSFRSRHLRGIYLRVVRDGHVAVGDAIEVLSRGGAA